MAILAHGIGPQHTLQSRPQLWRKWWFWVIIALLVLFVAAATWIGLRALAAKSELDAAQLDVGKLKTQATSQNFGSMAATLVALKGHSEAAARLTSDPVWRAGEFVPALGKNLRVVRQLAAVTNDVVQNTVAPLVEVASGLSPASFAPVNGGLNLKPLIQAVPAVARADKGLNAATKSINAINTAGTMKVIAGGKTQLSTLMATMVPLLDSANTLLPLLPPSMGATQPRTYVVMFLNNAESRALGGSALSFAELNIDKGKISLANAVSAGPDHFQNYSTPVISVPQSVRVLYGDAIGRSIANSTVRPDFPTAAQVVSEYWKRQFGKTVDGVISIDPVALSYILRATTPVQLPSGDVLTPDTLVPFLLNQVYQRYNSGIYSRDNAAQDAIYGQAVAATFAKLSGGPLDLKLLVAALQQAHTEGRINYWSSHPAEEAVLVKANLDGGLPKSGAKTDRVGVYFQDNVGSKLNFYLNQTVRTEQAVCRADGRESYRIGVDLASTVPLNAKSLSPSILGTWQVEKLKPGVQRLYVYVYAPPGSQIMGATINGAPVVVDALNDESYPVARLRVSVDPGASATMTVDITAKKAGVKALAAQVTPMVNNTKIVSAPLDCATVAGK
ncbi:MAG: hypothetical protein JWM49_3012 [Microbacteriaceae bacterium]|nr:hypothetical protein [Microbacteriaceae bacterium]